MLPQGLKASFCHCLDCFTPHLVSASTNMSCLDLDLGLELHARPWSLPEIMCLRLHPRLPSDDNVIAYVIASAF